MKKNKLKILYLDYETCSLIGKFYGKMWETNITKIIRDQQIMSGSYSWEGRKTVYSIGQDDFKDYKKGVFNDLAIVKFFSELCSKADYIVAQNGDKFDIKVLTSRIAFHKLPPIPKAKTFDTLKLSRNSFYLPTYSLKYLAIYFGIPLHKLEIKLIDIEDECEKGDASAWRELKRYGKRDAVVLIEVFKRILPYVKLPAIFNKTNLKRPECRNPICLSSNIQLRGKEIRADGRKLQRYACNDCGKWGSSLIRLIKK